MYPIIGYLAYGTGYRSWGSTLLVGAWTLRVSNSHVRSAYIWVAKNEDVNACNEPH